MTKIDEKVLTAISEAHGITIATLAPKIHENRQTVYRATVELLKEGKIVKIGNSRSTRYYPAGYDRTQHNEYDNIPIVVKKRKEPKEVPAFAPSPKSMIGKAQVQEIPADLKSYTEETVKVEEISIDEPVKAEKPKADVDTVLRAIGLLDDIGRTGTEADLLIEKAIGVLQKELELSIEKCPHCGAIPELICSGGKYRMECACGALFAHSKYATSAVGTITAYNQRVSA